MQTATADPLVGRRLEGRYRILDRIARGGMSVVYSAVDERLDRLVAVKVMSAALSADPAFSDRFAREARAAARLTHLNTVAVYDQGTDSGAGSGSGTASGTASGHHVFLVMELVEGRTLRELIRERGRFTPAEAISLMEPVLSALSAAHRAGLVHRDVKPENILLSDDGIVKVADFGLARAVEADAESTRTGLMMGTVAYCAPEQITRGNADQRSDVYAAGVMLFELLTGKPPYQGESAMNVAYQHVHSRVPAPSSRVKGIPSEIDELVVAATDSDPVGRPVDAGEFLAAIAEVRSELALPITPVPARERDARRARRAAPERRDGHTTDLLRRGGPAGPAGSAAYRHDTQIVPGHGSPLPRRAGDPPPPIVIPPSTRRPRRVRTEQERRRRRGLIALLVIVLLGLGGGVGAWWYAAGRYSKIPDVHGQTLATAQDALQNAGYRVGSVSSSFSEVVGKDEVIKTDPNVGSRLVRGRSVSIVLSLGQDRIAVPKIAGLSPAAAQAALQRGGVTQIRVTHQSSDTVDKDVVIGSTPTATAKIKRTDPVTIVVSTGPPILAVPNIPVGTPYPDARKTLSDAHFSVQEVEQYADSVKAGCVISLDPSDQQVKGGTITVTVSKGPEFVTLPQIPTGTPFKAAKTQLEALGLKVVRQEHFGAPLNEVFGMTPAAGQVVRVGSAVTLDVV